MEGPAISFAALVVIATAAFIIPILVNRIKRVRVPVVVGELLVGIIIGKSGLGIVKPEPWLDFLSTLGITYLMFLSGVEIDFRVLRRLAGDKGGRRLFLVSFLYLVVVLAGGVLAGFAFLRMGLVQNPWIVALITSTVSVGVVLPTLKERRLGSSEYGQTILVNSLLLDFVTILLLTVFVTFASGGDIWRLGFILILFAAVFIVYVAGERFRRHDFMVDLAHATSQIGVRGSFMLIFILSFLSENLGIEIILGAFLAGAIVSMITESDETSLHLKLDAIGFGFLVPVFFIMVGAEFDLRALVARPESILLAIAIIGAAYLIKGLPSLLFLGRFPLRRALGLGVLVTPGLSLTVAAAEIGFRLGLLTTATHAAMILLAVVTAAVSPVLFERLVPRGEAERKERLIIVGANERGKLLATRLSDLDSEMILVDIDEEKVEKARRRGFEAIRADVLDPEAWRRIAPDADTTVVVTTLVDTTNLRVVEILSEDHSPAAIVAQAGDPEMAERMTKLGARPVTPAFSTITVMENIVRHPNLFAILNHEEDDVRVQKAVVDNPSLDGVEIRRLGLPEGTLIMAIGRGREHLIPRGDTRIALGDVLTLAGRPEDVESAIRKLRTAAKA